MFTIYILDLGGNVRKNPKLSGTTHNVFGIQVGVSINIFVKRENTSEQPQTTIYYACIDEFWRKEQKYDFLDKKGRWGDIKWQEIVPDKRNNWLTEGISEDFETFLPMGTKKAKKTKGSNVHTIFKTFSLGVNTNRDAWVYNFNLGDLQSNISKFIETYNQELYRWHSQTERNIDFDEFVLNDESKIKWSSRLKECLTSRTKSRLFN